MTASTSPSLPAEIKADSGNRVALDELAGILVGCVIRTEAQGAHVDKQLKRVERAVKAPRRRAAAGVAPAAVSSATADE